MATKLPAITFYTGDWLKDPAITLCAPATRGVWFDLLCVMHEAGRSGELRGTRDQLARLARCSTAELTLALTDLQTTTAAEITERNGVVTLINRRMQRIANKRLSDASRQARYRSSRPPSMPPSSSVSSSDSPNGESPQTPDADFAFEEFWIAFPSGRKKSKAKAREAWHRALKKIDTHSLIAAAKAYAASEEGRGKWVKMPSSWLNGECWEDDREAWQRTDDDSPEAAIAAKKKSEQESRAVRMQSKDRELEATRIIKAMQKESKSDAEIQSVLDARGLMWP